MVVAGDVLVQLCDCGWCPVLLRLPPTTVITAVAVVLCSVVVAVLVIVGTVVVRQCGCGRHSDSSVTD